MIDITKLKNRWIGEWDPQYRYVKNDVVQWKGSTYVCLRDIPLEYVSSVDNMVPTINYFSYAPGIYIKTKDPRDTLYWLLFAPGTNFKDGWRPFVTYQRGDIVSLAGDVYIYTGEPYVYNTYPRDTTYWTKVFEAADRDQRLYAVQTWNQQPLGWTRNLGGRWWTGETGYYGSFGMIDAEGNANVGATKNQGHGTGDASQGYGSYGWYQSAFLFTGWQDSTQNYGTGRLTTPDGEAPKCIQWLTTADSMSHWLMNNGEVYGSGFNTQGQLGNSTTSATSNRAVRAYATDTTDWLGNTIPYTFANTRVIKIAVSSLGASSAPSIFALDDIGQVWAWGYNAYGQLGLGSDNTTSGSVGNATTNQTRPRCLPRSYFNGRKIVDIMTMGTNAAGTFAVDEDGNLWAWGCEGWGEMGLGQRTGSPTTGYSYYMTPRRVPVDFNQYGGIKKIVMNWWGSGTTRWTAILDGEGKMWIGGFMQNNSNNMNMWTNAVSTGNMISGHFIRLNKGWWRDHDIENFWICGDARGWSMYLREKGSGITYSLGHNQYGTLGRGGSNSYWWNSSGFIPEPGRMEGPRDVVDAWNNQGASNTTDTSQMYSTYVLICEDGSAWGQGQNSYGSLGLGYSGQTDPGMEYQDQYSGSHRMQRIPHMGGDNSKYIGGLGWGQGTYDAGMWITQNGQLMISGCDGTSSGHENWQGQFWTLRYYQSAISNPGAYHRYHIHGYHGG